MDSEYQFDAFDDGSSRLVGDKHLETMQEFIKTYATQLHQLEEALQESMSDAGDILRDPVALSLSSYEQTNIIELINTENKVFNKVLLVFAALCKETNQLTKLAREKFYAPFLLFGLGKEPEEGDAQTQIGTMLPFLKDLSDFVNRVYDLVKNYIHQLSSLYYSKEILYAKSFKNVHFNTVFYTLSELLTCLITLDEVIGQNQNFKTAWSMYKRMTKTIKQEATRYNATEEQLLQFEKLLLAIEGQLFDGLIFQNCIEQEFDFPGVHEVRSNGIFEKEFLTNIREMYTRMTAKTGDLNQIYQRRHLVGLCGLFTFHFILFKKISDKKFFKAIWELHKIIPMVHLVGNVIWLPNEFLKKKVPFMVKNTIGNPDVSKFQLAYLAELDKTFPENVNNFYLQVSTWMVRMESNLENRADNKTIISARITLFTGGLLLAFEIGDLFKQYIYLHSYLRKPIKPSRIRLLCKCIEMLKAVQFTFHRKIAIISESVAFMVQQIQYQLQKIFFPIKDKLESNNKFSDQKLDTHAAATLAMQMLNGCASYDRRLILRLAMNVLFQLNTLREEQIDDIKQQVRKLDIISSLEVALKFACNCSFFYWSRVLLPLYFKDVFENPETAQRLPYMFAALRDIVPLLGSVAHVDPKEHIQRFRDEIFSMLDDNILTPLCQAIETDLRLHIHHHLKVSERDPFKAGVKDLASLVNIKPFYFIDQVFSFKAHVTNYLDKNFYDYTTVALFDWVTYAEMRKLAEDRYNLHLAEVHLPGQSLEQGVDILEIMRNIHIFVTNYYYNLNTQVFIERTSEGRFLNTVNISHVSNSLRTHGAGIMNTTVNFAFQFLRQKFVVFSQFLYDDHIKSRLYKDAKFFKENKDKLDGRFPLERAENFIKEIRKLGVADDGSSYLDAFRGLITEIGNAMGYIRMVRSGGLYYTSNAIKFVPDLRDIAKFQELVSSEGLSQNTQDAAKNLDTVVHGLAKNFAEGTDYFKLLVGAFAPEFRNENNVHLKNFHIIVPALTLNFVNYMLTTKDKLQSTRKGQTPSYCFCDDGFAIGVAYILKLLDQNIDFDALHWFESITDQYVDENAKLSKLVALEKKGVKRTSKEQQTAQLTLKKNKLFSHEFELLSYSLSGARIFFKD